MEELIEKIKQKYEEKEKIIVSQKFMVEALKADVATVKNEMAQLRGQNMELEAKWNKMQKLLQGVQQ